MPLLNQILITISISNSCLNYNNSFTIKIFNIIYILTSISFVIFLIIHLLKKNTGIII